MIRHLCFSDDRMTNAARKCCESAIKHGCKTTTHFMPQHIDPAFNMDHIEILKQDRGAGYWLWKPYFILKVLQSSQDGDIVVYTDAGVEFVNDVQHLINEMTSPIMVFGNGWRHGDWCKGDVLEAMNADLYVEHDQVQASCLIIEVSEYTKAFIKEWLDWCCVPRYIDDSPSIEDNQATFREHRHDQAILTNLAIRENLTFNRWPAQYNLRGNEKYSNKYPQVFNHHGRRNDGTR